MPRKSLLFSLVLLVALALVLGAAGCSKSQGSKLVGTWVLSSGSGLTWQFAADGTFTQKSTAGGFPNATGKYTLSGSNLTMTLTGSGASAPTTATVDWVSNDQVKITLGGMSALTFNRQK